MGGTPIRATLVSYWTARPNAVLSVEDVMNELVEPRRRVQSGMGSLLNSGLLPGLRIVQSGNLWEYRPVVPEKNTEPRGETFEYVGTLKSGALILEDTEGILYRATELE